MKRKLNLVAEQQYNIGAIRKLFTLSCDAKNELKDARRHATRFEDQLRDLVTEREGLQAKLDAMKSCVRPEYHLLPPNTDLNTLAAE